MSSEVDDVIAGARQSWARISADYGDTARGMWRGHKRRARQRANTVGTKLALIAAANAVLLIVAAVVGAAVVPLGIMGAMAVLLLMVAVTLAIALAPVNRAPATPEKLREVDLKVLPARTERWLEAQRPTLPLPARALADRIGLRLEALTPQLAGLDGGTEQAFEVRRLIGEQLPAFVNDYARVPPTLRNTARNGKTPDSELVDGLRLIEREIAEMTERLAQTDLDALSTRGRFLEMKYRDENGPA